MTPNKFKTFVSGLVGEDAKVFLISTTDEIPKKLSKLNREEVGVFAGIPSMRVDDSVDKTDVKIPIVLYVLTPGKNKSDLEIYNRMDEVFVLIQTICERLKTTANSCFHKVEDRKDIDPEMDFSESNGYSIQFNLIRNEL